MTKFNNHPFEQDDSGTVAATEFAPARQADDRTLESAMRVAKFAAVYRKQLWELMESQRFGAHYVDLARLVDGTLHRRGRTKSRLIELVKALRRIFRLDEYLEFAKEPTLFTADCWRRTTRKELTIEAECSLYQLKMSLRELEEAGFLERKHPKIGPNRKALWIRLHIRGIHALLNQLFAKETGEPSTVRVAKDVPDKTKD